MTNSSTPKLQAQYSSDSYQDVKTAIRSGAKTSDIADTFVISRSTVRRIARAIDGAEIFDLAITDGATTVPVAAVTTSLGFYHACSFAISKYRGFFDGLSLPQWKLVAGENQVTLQDLREKGRAA